jgi:hypothetical protein
MAGFFFVGEGCTVGGRSGRRTDMPIWRLEPINPDDHHWQASPYAGPLIVRAADEDKARELAASQFRIGAEKPPGTEVPRTPWLYSWLATYTRIEASEFEEDGPETILDPEEALSRAPPPL